MRQSWFPWLRGKRGAGFKPASTSRKRGAGFKPATTSRPRRSSVPQLLVLEDRTVLSALTVLNNADSGPGSLRDTIAAAQSGDTIVFDPSLTYETITLSSGPLALSSNLTIDGPGADLLAISGNHASQLFTLNGAAQVTLADLTLTGGLSSQGGALSIGGTAALILDGDMLSGNQAVGDANGNALGGAVYNGAGASLTIDHTSFVNNQTNGANASFGGAIANAGTLSIENATFTGNAAVGSTTHAGSTSEGVPGGSQGGAIGNLDGSISTITLSSFTGNQALGSGTGSAQGGAICNEYTWVFPFPGSGVTTTVSQSTFQNNTAQGGSTTTDGGYGGAIEDNPGVNLVILNCSFTGNQANSGGGQNADGGAIDNSPGVTVTISDSQFISNSAVGSGVGASAVAGAVDNFQTMTIANSLFTGNSALGGPMADGVNTSGLAQGGAILTGFGFSNQVTVIFTLTNSIVAGNEAIGGSGGSTLVNFHTDQAVGGGILNTLGGTLNVVGCTITGNQAIGGASASGNGGAAFGGGINNADATLNLTDSTVSTNLCQGGVGASGAAGGLAAGGGINNTRVDALAIITNSTISLNECIGGVGGAGANGGDAVGAGTANAVFTLFGVADASSLVVSNCQIVGNLAQGGTEGSSAVGGDGLGGGLWAGSGTVVLETVLVSGNQAQGGVDNQGKTTGQGIGGGAFVDPSASATEDMQTLIAGNQASKSNNDVWGTITMVP
jgi:hypothetical protein